MVTTLISIGVPASIDKLVWSCDDQGELRLINAVMLRFKTGSWDPDPDLHAAEFVIGKIGGKVLHADKQPPGVKGRIY